MTAPEQPAGEGRAAAAAHAPRLRRGLVVQFTREDPVLGGSYTDVGVIMRTPDADGETVTVRPLAQHDVLVDPANVTPVAVDDVAG